MSATIGWLLFRDAPSADRPAPSAAPARAAMPAVAVPHEPARPQAHGPRSDATQPPIELTPGKPGYDGRLAKLWFDISIAELYEREPVDPVWAPAKQDELREIATQGMHEADIDGSVLRVECHTATCEVDLDLRAADEQAAKEYLVAFRPLGTSTSYGSTTAVDGRLSMRFSLVFGNAHRGIGALRAAVEAEGPVLEERRQEWLAERRRR